MPIRLVILLAVVVECGVGLVIDKSRVRLPVTALPRDNLWQVIHILVSLTKM